MDRIHKVAGFKFILDANDDHHRILPVDQQDRLLWTDRGRRRARLIKNNGRGARYPHGREHQMVAYKFEKLFHDENLNFLYAYQ